jgi:hypothetical protein
MNAPSLNRKTRPRQAQLGLPDSHSILPPDSPDCRSTIPIWRRRCGACHDTEARDWALSVHGKAMAAGGRDAPTCTDCHSTSNSEH